MSLDTYANLKASLVEWIKRNDISDADADDMIDLCESDIWDELRIREMEARATNTVSTSDRFLALPDGFIEMRRLKLNLAEGDCDIVYVAPDQMRIQSGGGIPKYFTVTTQLEFDRVPDSAYTIDMQYYKKLTALSSSNTTNTVLTDYPSIYLHGCLMHLHDFTLSEQRASYYRNLFENKIRKVNKRNRSGRYGAAPSMRTEGVTP